MFNVLLFRRKQGGLALDTGDHLILSESGMKVVNALSTLITTEKERFKKRLICRG